MKRLLATAVLGAFLVAKECRQLPLLHIVEKTRRSITMALVRLRG